MGNSFGKKRSFYNHNIEKKQSFKKKILRESERVYKENPKYAFGNLPFCQN